MAAYAVTLVDETDRYLESLRRCFLLGDIRVIANIDDSVSGPQ